MDGKSIIAIVSRLFFVDRIMTSISQVPMTAKNMYALFKSLSDMRGQEYLDQMITNDAIVTHSDVYARYGKDFDNTAYTTISNWHAVLDPHVVGNIRNASVLGYKQKRDRLKAEYDKYKLAISNVNTSATTETVDALIIYITNEIYALSMLIKYHDKKALYDTYINTYNNIVDFYHDNYKQFISSGEVNITGLHEVFTTMLLTSPTNKIAYIDEMDKYIIEVAGLPTVTRIPALPKEQQQPMDKKKYTVITLLGIIFCIVLAVVIPVLIILWVTVGILIYKSKRQHGIMRLIIACIAGPLYIL
jgi:hypothetical protein